MPTIVDGVASSVAIDTAGEIVDLKGLDISSLVGAPANWEHESKLPSQIIGKIIEAHKIFSEEDCQNERHQYFWNKAKIPFLYCKVRLFDDEENKKPSAVEVASLFKDDAAHPEEQPIVGFSIEGSKLNKEGVTVTHSIARKLTITCIPANKTCIAELVPSKEDKKIDFIFGKAKEFFKNEESLEKKETKIATSINETNENVKENKQKAGKKIPTSKNETNEGLEKALDAGSMVAAPSALVGGSSLGKESLDKKIKKSSDKPFHGYNPKKHSREGGLKDSYREKYNKEHGSHLKRPVTGKVKPGSKAAKRRKSFCARMSGVSGPTSKDGKLTPKGAALKRWKCSKSEESSLEKKDRCWEGYEPTPGKKPYEKGSCRPMKKSDWSKKADDAYQGWMDKDSFKKYMKKRMPHLADGEVDAIGRILALKKEMQKEEGMSKMYASYFRKNENEIEIVQNKSEEHEELQKSLKGLQIGSKNGFVAFVPAGPMQDGSIKQNPSFLEDTGFHHADHHRAKQFNSVEEARKHIQENIKNQKERITKLNLPKEDLENHMKTFNFNVNDYKIVGDPRPKNSSFIDIREDDEFEPLEDNFGNKHNRYYIDNVTKKPIVDQHNAPVLPKLETSTSNIKKADNLNKTTDIMMATEEKNNEMCLPKEEFQEEHERLIDVLGHPTAKKLKEEKKKQEKEVKKNEIFEKLQKSPIVDEGYSNVQIPSHPTKSGNYVKTKIHKPTGNRIHVVHAKDKDGTHMGSIYYTTENGKRNGKVTSQIHIDHFDPEYGSLDVARVSHALTEKEHRGKGLNPLLHVSALKDFGEIQSDTTLSPASQKIYEKLAQHPNVEVKMGAVGDEKSQHILRWKPKIKKSEKIIFDKNIIKKIANK